MLVLVQVSSINTNRAGSNMPCSRIQRRRARAMSARFCSSANKVFFIADIPSIEEPPHRSAAARDAFLAHGCHDLLQRHIWPLGDQPEQKFGVLLKRGGAAAAWLRRNAASFLPALGPDHHHTRAKLVSIGCLTTRCASLDVFDYSARKSLEYGLGIDPPESNQC